MDNWSVLILIVLLVGLMVWNIYRQRKMKPANKDLEVAIAVITSVDRNQKILEERIQNRQSKKLFDVNNWEINKDKLEFLSPEMVITLREAFTLAEEYNARIDTAKKSKVLSSLVDMPVENLKEPLAKSREGLVAWLKASYEEDKKNNPRRGCLGI